MWYFADASNMNRRKLKENCHKLALAYCSGFWSLITLLFLSSVPAHAEWVAVEKDYLLPGLQTVYVDPDTIRREGNLVTIWQLIDFKQMQGNAGMGPLGFGPNRFLSTKTHKQFDCAGKRLRLLAFTEFSRGMGTGIPANGYVDHGNWIPVEPNSINQALWDVTCGKE
jgi:hypothetical protein